jgi:hypothetical protein
MVYVSEKSRWVREEQLSACLSNVATLCAGHLQGIAKTCAVISADPRKTKAAMAAVAELACMGAALLNTFPARPSEHVMRLMIVQRRLRGLLEDAALLRWLARYHPDALSLLLTACEAGLQPRRGTEDAGS